MKLSDFINGLKVLQPYYTHKYCLGAEHEIFYAYATDKPLSSEDVKKMIKYGWHQETDDGEFSEENYDSDESWCAFI